MNRLEDVGPFPGGGLDGSNDQCDGRNLVHLLALRPCGRQVFRWFSPANGSNLKWLPHPKKASGGVPHSSLPHPTGPPIFVARLKTATPKAGLGFELDVICRSLYRWCIGVDHEIFCNECDEEGKNAWPEACIEAPGVGRAKIHESIGNAALKFFHTA